MTRWLVWSDEYGTRKDAVEVQAIDAGAAAVRAASDDYHSGGWDRDWPIEYTVEDPRGARFLVNVDVEMVPEFSVSKPRPL